MLAGPEGQELNFLLCLVDLLAACAKVNLYDNDNEYYLLIHSNELKYRVYLGNKLNLKRRIDYYIVLPSKEKYIDFVNLANKWH